MFPSDFHLRTLELYLSTCSTLDDKVDVKSIMSKLMDRLATYAAEHEIPSDNPVFDIFNTQVAAVIKVISCIPFCAFRSEACSHDDASFTHWYHVLIDWR